MTRRLAVENLEDRRLLAAQPLLGDVSSVVAAPLESRLIQVDLLGSLDAGAASRPLPLTSEAGVQAMILQPDGIDPFAVTQSLLSESLLAASAADALTSITSQVSQNLESLRPMIQDAFASPISSDARREFLELAGEIVDQVIGRIEAEELQADRIPIGADAPPELTDAMRSLVLSRLLAVHSTIDSRLQSQSIPHFEPSASGERGVETVSFVTETQYQFELNSDAERAAWLAGSSITVEQGAAEREPIYRSDVADAANPEQLKLLTPSDAADSEAAFPRDTINAPRSTQESTFANAIETELGSQTSRLALFALGDLVGGVSSLDVLSALDATATELLETVDDVRPRIDVPLAACLAVLTIGYVLHTRNLAVKELDEEFDAEGETLKLGDRVSRPSFG